MKHRLETTAKLIAVGLPESGRPRCGPQALTTATACIGTVPNDYVGRDYTVFAHARCVNNF